MRKYGFIIAAIAIVGFVVVLGAMSSVQAANPMPLQAPTPVSVGVRSNNNSDMLTFYATDVLTAARNSAVQNVQDSDVVDLQWVIDQTLVAAAPNTTTLKLQFSNDGVNWVDGSTFVTANAADVNDMNQFPVFGRYLRVNTSASNSLPFTLTVNAVAK